jgi:3-hydroxymyristoyl/3-hydroxydecanoyl-(acyl carrier protein) dehydratase
VTLTTVERGFPPDHASALGHFPGNPIIPGALLLSEVLRAIETDLGRTLYPFQIKAAKFLHPVRPGDRLLIEFSGPDGKKIKFSCTASGTEVLVGEVELLNLRAGGS